MIPVSHYAQQRKEPGRWLKSTANVCRKLIGIPLILVSLAVGFVGIVSAALLLALAFVLCFGVASIGSIAAVAVGLPAMVILPNGVGAMQDLAETYESCKEDED